MSSYATPADTITRFDVRVLGNLVNDSDTPQTATQLLTDLNLQAALDDGTGLINAAILIGGRYTVTQIQALTGTDKAFLIRLNTNLAYGLLLLRRGNDPELFSGYKDAMDILDQLRDGKLMFNVAADVAVGVPNSLFPSVQTYNTVGLLRDRASRLFPVRQDQRVAPN